MLPPSAPGLPLTTINRDRVKRGVGVRPRQRGRARILTYGMLGVAFLRSPMSSPGDGESVIVRNLGRFEATVSDALRTQRSLPGEERPVVLEEGRVLRPAGDGKRTNKGMGSRELKGETGPVLVVPTYGPGVPVPPLTRCEEGGTHSVCGSEPGVVSADPGVGVDPSESTHYRGEGPVRSRKGRTVLKVLLSTDRPLISPDRDPPEGPTDRGP